MSKCFGCDGSGFLKCELPDAVCGYCRGTGKSAGKNDDGSRAVMLSGPQDALDRLPAEKAKLQGENFTGAEVEAACNKVGVNSYLLLKTMRDAKAES